MEIVFRICLGLAGLINLAPSLLVFMPQKIAASYGVSVPDANYELLLRHRAVLFGIVGGLLIYSAISRQYYDLASLVGLLSMISFLVLYGLMDGPINAELSRVMRIDLLGSVLLLGAYLLYRWYS